MDETTRGSRACAASGHAGAGRWSRIAGRSSKWSVLGDSAARKVDSRSWLQTTLVPYIRARVRIYRRSTQSCHHESLVLFLRLSSRCRLPPASPVCRQVRSRNTRIVRFWSGTLSLRKRLLRRRAQIRSRNRALCHPACRDSRCSERHRPQVRGVWRQDCTSTVRHLWTLPWPRLHAMSSRR